MKKPKFDKKNAIKFANKIYDGKTGKFTKLCQVDVDDGELCCILGEARNYFLNTKSKNTDMVCRQLANKAVVSQVVVTISKNLLLPKQNILYDSLNRVAEKNDSGRDAYKQRARRVKNFWIENIVPLLK